MKLNIDGREVQARAGESLLDMITKMGLRTGKLSDEPLAAKIAGDVFTLNYCRAFGVDYIESDVFGK